MTGESDPSANPQTYPIYTMSDAELSDVILGATDQLTVDTRSHQDDAIIAVAEAVANGQREVLVDSAVGSGKTIQIVGLASALSEHGTVGIIVPRRAPHKEILGINTSTPEGFKRFAPHILEENGVGYYSGTAHVNPDARIQLVTAQKLLCIKAERARGLEGLFATVVMDEAHRGLGDKTWEMLEEVNPRLIVGFTGSTRLATKDAAGRFGEAAYSLSLREGIESGINAPLRVITYVTDAEIPEDNEAFGAEFSEKQLASLAKLEARNRAVIDIACDLSADGRQGTILTIPGGDLAHARYLAEELSKRVVANKHTGVAKQLFAVAVSGNMPQRQIDQALALFEQGAIDWLTYVDVINESWNTQKASAFIHAAPTTSPAKIIQGLGRAMRPKSDGRDTVAVSLVDTSRDKRQVIVATVMGEDVIEQGLSLEKKTDDSPPQTSTNRTRANRQNLSDLLRPDLLRQILVHDGVSVEELTYSGRNVPDRVFEVGEERNLVGEANRLLGLDFDAEIDQPDYMGEDVTLIRYLGRFIDMFVEEFGEAPTVEDLRYFEPASPDITSPDMISSDHQSVLGNERAVSEDLFLHKANNAVPVVSQELELELLEQTIFDQMADQGVSDIETADTFSEALDTMHAMQDSVDAFDMVYRAVLKASVRDVLDGLSDREREIVGLRFGLDDDRPRTLEEVASEFGVTRERIRQIETHTLAKLRHPLRSDSLRDFRS